LTGSIVLEDEIAYRATVASTARWQITPNGSARWRMPHTRSLQ
jgi:hypothetical protein